jgi:hypothetical protein
MIPKTFAIVFSLVAMLALTGSQCVIIATSGGRHPDCSDEDTDKDPCPVVIVATGRLVDAPVQGVRYVSGSRSGTTGVNGEFQYELDTPVRFFIGDIPLGETVRGKAVITPLDLVPDGTIDTPAVINIARLLQSLDAVPGDGRISIPAKVRAAAVRSNAAVSSPVRFLDFADEPAFVNAASHLVAVLTASYPFTAVLVDAASAKQHLVESLAGSGIAVKIPRK